jgi:hypothetical protein
MKTTRAISINNSLVHGICNCNCLTCSVNKPHFRGMRAFQPEEVTRKITERVQEASRGGAYVRYIANSGDGEPTLHPEFSRRMELFGQLKKAWHHPVFPAPEVSVVSNGHTLHQEHILEILEKNRISLKVSFPTSHPAHYGEIMVQKPERGPEIFETLIPAIGRALSLHGRGRIALEFHISPPYREYVRADFPETVDFLTDLAGRNGAGEVNLLMFPALANRAGSVPSFFGGVDMYRDFFKAYQGKVLNGVRVSMAISAKRFYPDFSHFIDLFRAFNYPCIWYGNLFLAPTGDSACCNDQSLGETRGNILTHSIQELMELKENKFPSMICRACNQAPEKLYGSPTALCFRLAAGIKLRYARRKRRKAEGRSAAPHPLPAKIEGKHSDALNA